MEVQTVCARVKTQTEVKVRNIVRVTELLVRTVKPGQKRLVVECLTQLYVTPVQNVAVRGQRQLFVAGMEPLITSLMKPDRERTSCW
jgi:hypothetical protein